MPCGRNGRFPVVVRAASRSLRPSHRRGSPRLPRGRGGDVTEIRLALHRPCATRACLGWVATNAPCPPVAIAGPTTPLPQPISLPARASPACVVHGLAPAANSWKTAAPLGDGRCGPRDGAGVGLAPGADRRDSEARSCPPAGKIHAVGADHASCEVLTTGDRRFVEPCARVKDAQDRAGGLHALSDQEVIAAPAHASRGAGPPSCERARHGSGQPHGAGARHLREPGGRPPQRRRARTHPRPQPSRGEHAAMVARRAGGQGRGRDDPFEGPLRREHPEGRAPDAPRPRVGRGRPVGARRVHAAGRLHVPGRLHGRARARGGEVTGIAFREITERKAFEQERTSWLNLVDAVYHVHDELSIGTLIVDEGRIHDANNAFRAILGYSLEEQKAEIDDVFALFLRRTASRSRRTSRTPPYLGRGGEPSAWQGLPARLRRARRVTRPLAAGAGAASRTHPRRAAIRHAKRTGCAGQRRPEHARAPTQAGVPERALPEEEQLARQPRGKHASSLPPVGLRSTGRPGASPSMPGVGHTAVDTATI